MNKNEKKESACEKELKKSEAESEKLQEKIEEKKEELDSCREDVKDFKKKADEYYDQLVRLKADFENFRKRVEKEKPELVNWGKNEVILKIFPLYDILLSAHEHLSGVDPSKCEKTQIEEVLKGLDMIFKEFSKFFEYEGIRPMDILNKPYDPMMCEIIGIDVGNDENDGLITEVLQKGYMLKDKVLRPAKVKIAKKVAQEDKK